MSNTYKVAQNKRLVNKAGSKTKRVYSMPIKTKAYLKLSLLVAVVRARKRGTHREQSLK